MYWTGKRKDRERLTYLILTICVTRLRRNKMSNGLRNLICPPEEHSKLAVMILYRLNLLETNCPSK